MLAKPPLSLYVHVPWCVKKCPYCDFNSHEFGAHSALPEDDYIAALCADFDRDFVRACAGEAKPRPIHSIFIGGGTPSLFSAQSFEKLLQHIASSQAPGWLHSESLEITLEANPGTLEAGRFADYRAAGINRLSLGIQSFDDAQLRRLGRIHDSAQARRAIESVSSAGFTNFNLDLMHGLPEQTLESALADLSSALDFEPTHLSWYQLTIEPNTVFFSKPPPLPRESLLTSVQDAGHALLIKAGFEQYEVSAYARSAASASKHNLNYWQFGDYLGIGAGAHGKLTVSDAALPIRTRKLRQPDHYLRAALADPVEFSAQSSVIAKDEIAVEYLLNSLRTKQGFTVSAFEARTGLAYEVIASAVDRLIKRSLLIQYEEPETRITTTDKGFRYLNNVLEEFL